MYSNLTSFVYLEKQEMEKKKKAVLFIVMALS